MKNPKVIGLYLGVALLSIGIIMFFRSVGAAMPDAAMPVVSDTGKESVETFFPIQEDLDLIIQSGEEVKLTEIRGEVTVVAQFFAVCPHCAIRNGMELGEIYKKFGDNPDFRIVCITVDPDNDKQQQLAEYGEVMEADPSNWWFASAGNEQKTHTYLEEQLKFFKIQEWTNPVDQGSFGRFNHDLGFLLIDRDFNVIGKWPLAEARSDAARERDPQLYERLKADMYSRIQTELDKS